MWNVSGSIMATQRHRLAAEASRAVETLGRITLIGLFTGVETLALVIWLGLVENAPAASQMAALGLGILAVGLFVEHFLTHVAVSGWDQPFPAGPAAFFSASEAALWALWLGIAENVPAERVAVSLARGGLELPPVLAETANFLLAAVVFSVLLIPQHTIEDNALRGDSTFASVFSVGTIGFSLLEGFGSTVWLLLVLEPGPVRPLLRQAGLAGTSPATLGVVVLAVTLLVEHVVGVRFARR